MRITAVEYSRGLLSWHAVQGLSIRIGTAPDATTAKTWSPPLTDPDGSVVPIELQDKIQFEFGLKAPAGVIELATFWIRLERVQKGVVFTRYFHGLPEAPVILKHLPDYGTYHRLGVDASAMSWEQDLVFRELGILVRFVNGEVEGEAMSDLTPGLSETGDPVLQGEQKTVRRSRVSTRCAAIVERNELDRRTPLSNVASDDLHLQPAQTPRQRAEREASHQLAGAHGQTGATRPIHAHRRLPVEEPYGVPVRRVARRDHAAGATVEVAEVVHDVGGLVARHEDLDRERVAVAFDPHRFRDLTG
jgi:hypothetical protein